MSVLDRVKLFLPAIKQANLELAEKIKAEGVHSVQIDSSLQQSSQQQVQREGGGGGGGQEQQKSSSMTNGDDNDEEEEEEEEDDEGESGANDQRKVQLEFALGDFDESTIAKTEELLEAENETEDDVALKANDGDEEEDEEEEEAERRKKSIFKI